MPLMLSLEDLGLEENNRIASEILEDAIGYIQYDIPMPTDLHANLSAAGVIVKDFVRDVRGRLEAMDGLSVH